MDEVEAVKRVTLLNAELAIPSVREALARPYTKEWQTATEAEFNALNETGTLILTDRPTKKKVIGCRWMLQGLIRA